MIPYEFERRLKKLERKVCCVLSNTALEINTQTADYQLILSDGGTLLETDVAIANTITIPADATVNFPIGTEIAVVQYGAGQTSFLPAVGVTINSAGGLLSLASQFSAATLIKRAANEWYLIGDLA